MVRLNSDNVNFSSGETDYADPEYYRHIGKQPPASAPAHEERVSNPYDPYQPYSSGAASPSSGVTDIDTPVGLYDAGRVREYRGPEGVEGYTSDVGNEQREAAKQGTWDSNKKRGLAGIGAVLLGLGAWLLKLKGVAVFLKFGWTGVTAIISIAFYAVLFGWSFAIGLVALLFIHEMGHALVMKLKGIPIGAVTFIPMLGAAVTMRQMPSNAQDEAEVGIAGPIAGALASGVCLLIAELHPDPNTVWAPLAYFGFFINLFNLIPIVPFDGGRILAAIDRRIWLIGFIGLLAFQIWQWTQGNFSPWLLIFVIIAAVQLWSRGFTPDTPEAKAYYNVPLKMRISLSLLYFGLIAVLVLGMALSHSMMPILVSE
jgi:Zn-dependent protease